MKRDGRIHEQHSIPSKQRPRWLGDGMESIQIREYILNLIPLETEYFVEKSDVEAREFFELEIFRVLLSISRKDER